MTDGLQPPPPATAAEARGILDTRIADKSWGAALLAGDVATNAEYRELRAKADNPDPADQVAEALRGHEISEQEFKLVEGWRARHMRDPIFAKEFLNGNPEARREMVLSAIALSGGVKGSGGSF